MSFLFQLADSKRIGFVAICTAAMIPSVHGMLIQDFESDVSGITTLPYSGSSVDEEAISITDIIKRSNGTDSSSGANSDILSGVGPNPNGGGNWYGEVRNGFENSAGDFFLVQGDRVSWNDGPASGGFQSGFGQRIDVYFDDLSFYGVNDGFYFQSTLMDDTNDFAINGGGFGARVVDNNGSLAWRIGVDGDVKGFSGVTGGTLDITTPGWYTMETIWLDDGSGNVNRVDTLYDASGIALLSETAEDLFLVSEVGQVGSASFGNGDEDGTPSLATAYGIDNAVKVVPEPGAYSLIAGLLFLSYSLISRRKQTLR